MGQEADADEHLQLRLRRVFAVVECSFRMDRRSPAAADLRSAVADVLPRFPGNYSDETLAGLTKHHQEIAEYFNRRGVSLIFLLHSRVSNPSDGEAQVHGLANEICRLRKYDLSDK